MTEFSGLEHPDITVSDVLGSANSSDQRNSVLKHRLRIALFGGTVQQCRPVHGSTRPTQPVKNPSASRKAAFPSPASAASCRYLRPRSTSLDWPARPTSSTTPSTDFAHVSPWNADCVSSSTPFAWSRGSGDATAIVPRINWTEGSSASVPASRLSMRAMSPILRAAAAATSFERSGSVRSEK